MVQKSKLHFKSILKVVPFPFLALPPILTCLLLHVPVFISFWFLLPVFLFATVSRCTHIFSFTKYSILCILFCSLFFPLNNIPWKSPHTGSQRSSSLLFITA